jgi:hypothetical protein
MKHDSKIASAEQFVAWLTSADRDRRAAQSAVTFEVWLEAIERYPELRFWVAQNKAVPVSILEILAGDEDARVRWMVAQKGKASPDILRQLATDPADSVRMRVALNAKTPQIVLASLLQDPWDEVAKIAQARLRQEFGDVS